VLRRARAAIALLAATALTGCATTLTGCAAPPTAQWHPPASAAPPAPSPATSLAADPVRALRAVVDRLTAVPYNYEFDNMNAQGTEVVGATDPVTRAVRMYQHRDSDAGLAGYELRRIGNSAWLWFDRTVPAVGGQWFRLDLKRVHQPRRLMVSEFPDPTGIFAGLRRATRANSSVGGFFAGIAPFTAAGVGRADLAAHLAKLGARAGAVPFSVSVDDGGYVKQVDLELPAAGGLPETDYRLYIASPGESAGVAAPTRNIHPAASYVYSALNTATG
jgi:hypothetical protein